MHPVRGEKAFCSNGFAAMAQAAAEAWSAAARM